jgi:hypothetical protein
MKRSVRFIGVMILAVLCGLPLTPAAVSAQAPLKVKLEEGTQVRLKLMEPLDSRKVREGTTVSFEVLDDIRVGEALVIAEGAPAWGSIIEAQGGRMFGRGGKLKIRIDYVKAVDNTKIPLRAQAESQGKGRGVTTGVAIGTAAVLMPIAAPFFLFIKGKHTEIPRGQHFPTFVDGDRMITPRLSEEATAPAPVTTASYMQASLHTPTAIARPNATDFGAVNIISDPGGAEVEIDGAYYGNTPGLIRLPAGLHTLTIRSAGFQPWKRTLNIGPGSSLTVKADLARAGTQAARNGGN